MGDRYLFSDHVHEPERPSELGANDQLHAAIQDAKRNEVYLVIRNTLNDAGIPFPRSIELAERCIAALKEIA